MLRTSFAFSCVCLLVACDSSSGSGVIRQDASPLPDVGASAGSGGGSGGATDRGGDRGTGGVTSTGGSTTVAGTGGAFGTGGASTTGGGPGSGGTTGTGGASATGGASGTGGRTGTGGASGSGATSTSGTGGRTGTGGSTATGGTTSGTGGATGTGGSTGAGGGSCTTPPDPSPLIGWASQSGNGTPTTTGGGSATPTPVTTLADLQNAAKGSTAAVIYVKGVMAAGSVSIASNKTIVGLCGAELHGHVSISSSNVIVRNIKIVGYAVGNCALDPSYDSSAGCSSGQDAISVQSGHHIWFDHCDISDGTDGNLDITNGADFVTVSWTKFHYTARTDNSGSDSTGASGHRFSNLVGGDDGTTSDAGKLNITWHHNWWTDNVVERQPRVRFGKNHIFNNLYTSTASNYCVRAGIQAQILVEDNVFSGVKNPQQFNSTSDQATAYITSSNNVYTNTSGTQATGGGGTPFTTPPYAYTPDATSGLQAAIQAGAGPK